MKSRPLDNVALTRNPKSWWLLAGLGLVLALTLLSSVSIRRVQLRVDPVTGSMSSRTIWPFGITSGPTFTPSPLARRLKQIGLHRNPTWQFLSEARYNAWGHPRSVACGIAPPIYQLRPVLQAYVAASTDEELRSFAKVMQSGTPAEQQAALDAAADKGLARLQRGP